MGFDFTGHVLRAPRVAPGNASTTSDPSNGVIRDVRVPPATRTAAQPEVVGLPGTQSQVDLSGDQYRAAVLQAPGTSPIEYLVWVANSSQLALVDTASWWTSLGTGRIPVGATQVANLITPLSPFTDGTTRVIITDDGDREIGTITLLVIARGDKTYDDDGWVDIENPAAGRLGSAPYEVVVPGTTDQNGVTGLVTLKDENVFAATGAGLVAGTLVSVLGGGLSVARGDVVVEGRYTVAPVKFWWTRNDRYETRFGWADKLQRWKPYKGSAPINLGQLLFDTTYTLSPKMRTLPLGAILTGDSIVFDGYSVIRVGPSPGALSVPVGVSDPDGFTGVQVVLDAQVGAFDFTTGNLSGVVGQNSGIVRFNPAFVTLHAGNTVWYCYRSFSAEASGSLGSLLGADSTPLYLAPIPGPTDHPFIRIANRTPLAVTFVDLETDLEGATDPVEGSCLVALSTGRLRLSVTDIHKADPERTTEFNKHFLGAEVFYEGVALNGIPQPTKAPVPLVQADGVTQTLAAFDPMYLPLARMWPEDIEGTSLEPYMGLGVSGVLQLPDGTGAVPDPESVDPVGVAIPVRPGGDALPAPQSLGLVRAVNDGVGDSILFSRDGAITELVVTDRISDVPSFPFQVPGGKAFIAKEATVLPGGEPASLVQIGSNERDKFAGKAVYFLQATLTPATYTTKARLYSKSRIIFRFDGTEVLYFSIDGTAHDWHASSLAAQEFYSAEEVADSIQARITVQGGTGSAQAIGDRVLLEALDPDSGTIEIGWGATRDLSGCAALGFLPGWRVIGGKPNWLSDAGISVGLSRSLLNLDRAKADSDYRARTRLEDVVLSESIPAGPFSFLDFQPVEDIAGFDDGVFFNLQTFTVQGDDVVLLDRRLEHFEDIQHRFPESKIAWLEQTVSSNPVLGKTTALALGHSGVVPESLLGAPGINGALLVATDGGRYVVQKQGVDYILPNEGVPGVAQLVTRHGARMLFGGSGEYTQGGTTFTDLNSNFLADSTDPDIDPATGQQRLDPTTSDLMWLPVLRVGFRLKLSSGPAVGSYIVTAVTDATHVEVSPPFIATADRPTSWEAFSGVPDSLYDPGVVADVVYKPFDHLPDEPFKIRTLAPVGVIATAGTVAFKAYVEDANAKGRLVSLRFGPVHPAAGVVATLTPLTLTDVGVVANNQLVLPWTTHVSEGAFVLRVGTEMFTPVPVTAFSVDPSGVEYLTVDWVDGEVTHLQGEVKFATAVLADLESSHVVLAEVFRQAVNLTAGQAEYDPKTGDLIIASADATTFVGKTLYFVEQMVTTGTDRDVAVSPMIGAVSFVKPLPSGHLVEMVYWLADSEGRRVGGPTDTITEFLPVFVRREEAVRLNAREFELDPTGIQVWDDRIDPVVYIGPTQQNFGRIDFTTDRPGHLKGLRFSFDRAIPDWVTPVASYAVFNAQGGERSYTTSQQPVYRPPFFIKAGKDNFGLRGDRTADFVPGQMLRLGAECFYLTQVRYFAPTDVTRVDIYPSTVLEVGSRSPGNDVLALVTSVPITTTLFPDSMTPVLTTAKAGFMQEIPTTDFPFEPVQARQASMTFRGDLTQFAVPGHIMEISGVPFTIAQVTLSEDGTRTKISFTTAFQQAVDPKGNPTIKLSYRPVYPPEVRVFVGKGPLVASEGVEITLFGEVLSGVVQPGRQLVQGTEFSVDSETGAVQLLSPVQPSLGPGQWLLLSFTQMRTLEPFFAGGSLVSPRWAAVFRYNTLPSKGNGFLGGRLTATYTFDNPDSFYFRALPLRSYLPQALKQAVDEMRRGQATSGPRLTVPPGDNNWDHGNLGLLSQRRDLQDKDRAARAFLGFYNDAILTLEQVEETITGEFIGDRDGKFRFWIGFGQEYAPPGYEDDITGVLNPTNVWNRVFNEADPSQDLTFLAGTDPLVVPSLCTMTDLILNGEPLGSATLGRLIQHQSALIRNDVDDLVLLGPTQPEILPSNVPPYYTVQMGGHFSRMGLPHRFSRLFPTTARVFFTLQPGIGSDVANGDVGVFAWRRVNSSTGEAESTNNAAVGQVANPVLGRITNISENVLRPRTARTRIWGYFPNGLSADAFGVAVDKPCMVVSAVPLAQLPIDPATGYPDPTKLLSQPPGTGDVPDAIAGDPRLALPGFKVGDKVAFGTPGGRLLEAVYPEEIDVFGQKVFTGIFVGEVLHGCVITFQNRKNEVITSPGKVMVATSPNEGLPADVFGIGKADTLYVVPPDAENPIVDPATESPTVAMQQQAADQAPAFRQGFDLTVRTDGQVVDLSLPSWDDPSLFPTKELFGQKSPTPMGHIEGSVEFANLHEVPLDTPALRGDARDDSGDYQIPYRKGTSTELDRFDEIHNLLGRLMDRDPVFGGYYPDEILFVDGAALDAAVSLGGGFYREPATLMTATNVLPLPTFGTTPGRAGDFVLVEVDPGAPQGWQGLLSVGAIRSANVLGTDVGWVEPPRFVSQTNKGSAIRYALKNYAVHTTSGNYPTDPQVQNPPGVRLYDDLAGGTTIISFQDVVLGLNDGSVAGIGNLNTILAADPGNVLRIKVIGRPDDTYVNAPAGPFTVAQSKDGRVLLTIHITSATAEFVDFQGNTTGALAHGGVVIGSFDPGTGEPLPGTVADNRHIIINGLTGAIPFTPAVGTPSQWFLPHIDVPLVMKSSIYGWEFALDVDCTAGTSTSAFVDSDRLTFHEALDLESLSRPRGFLHSNGVLPDYIYETELRVTEVTLGTGVWSSVNDVVTPDYLSFVSRSGSASLAGGTWNPAPSPNEDGSLRVMAFEDGNTPIVAADIIAAVQTSQTVSSVGGILSGNGVADRNSITSIVPVGPGSEAMVLKGDAVYIDRSDTGLGDAATEKAGTYIVRHAVLPDPGNPYKAVSASAEAGTGGGFLTTKFPRCVSLDVAGDRLEIDDNTMLPGGGWAFVLLSSSDLNSPTPAVFQKALFKVGYLGFDLAGPNPKLILIPGTYTWADNAPIGVPATDIPLDRIAGQLMSWTDIFGLMDIQVQIRGGNLPDDSSVVGYHNPGTAVYGFNALTLENYGVASILAADIVVGAPAAGQVQIGAATVFANETFDPTGEAVVYPRVPALLTLQLSNVQAGLLNDPQNHLGGGPGVTCLLPGTDVRTEDGVGVAGFFALGGVFLEPSVPQQPLPLSGNPKVVDATRSLLAGEVGMRSATTPEMVHFEVRRVRRWHGLQNGLNDACLPLKYAYEVRRGTIDGFSRSLQQVGLITATGTNLGGFNDDDVNIHLGDIFRVLDADGVVLDEGVIAEVVSSTQVKVAAPGLSRLVAADLVGKTFEVYLRQAPVPHQQSNEQLLDLITDRVVHETRADRTDPDPLNWVGGFVPETDGSGNWADVANKLYDDSVGGVNFTNKGVKKNDILIVDPVGVLPGMMDKGFRPLGDRSVPSRTANGGPSPYLAGSVSPLDDNRGFYRVTVVHDDHLEVTPLHLFAGGLGSDVLMGGTRTNLAYAVYPTVSTSLLSVDAAEGQNDLRPTKKPVGGLYYPTGNGVLDNHSIRPFSYKILRPSSMFSSKMVDTVLMMRERMLSLIEVLGTVTNGVRGGFYWDGQNAEHLENLGTPTDPESGLGLFPNRLIVGLVGESAVSPFANNSSCLSLLDRRFWVQDSKLDSLAPDPNNPYAMVSAVLPFDQVGGPYTAYTDVSLGGSEVRPVLTDHLDLILDVRDRLRSIRHTWLTYRAHRFLGTLARIDQFDAEFPKRLADRQRTLLLEATVSKVAL